MKKGLPFTVEIPESVIMSKTGTFTELPQNRDSHRNRRTGTLLRSPVEQGQTWKLQDGPTAAPPILSPAPA